MPPAPPTGCGSYGMITHVRWHGVQQGQQRRSRVGIRFDDCCNLHAGYYNMRVSSRHHSSAESGIQIAATYRREALESACSSNGMQATRASEPWTAAVEAMESMSLPSAIMGTALPLNGCCSAEEEGAAGFKQCEQAVFECHGASQIRASHIGAAQAASSQAYCTCSVEYMQRRVHVASSTCGVEYM